MNRPCTCDRDGCRLCFLYRTDRRYHLLWGGTEETAPRKAKRKAEPTVRRTRTVTAAAPVSRLACIHRGKIVRNIKCACPAGVNVYSCAVKGECVQIRDGGARRAAVEASGLPICRECTDREPTNQWAGGLTMVPARLDLAKQTLASIAAAGWRNPWVFCDGEIGRFHPRMTVRPQPIGAFGNFFLGLQELMLRYPTAEKYVMVQDDVVFSRNVRQFLERGTPTGILSLHTIQANEGPPGWNRVKRWGSGAQAYVIPRELAKRIVGDSLWLEHPKEKRGRKQIDTIMDRWCRAQNVPHYTHTPSLSQHVGFASTLGHAFAHKHKAVSFRGPDFDATELP